MKESQIRQESRIDAAVAVGIGQVELIQNSWSAPIDRSATAPAHRLELALLPRSALSRCCFPDDWGPHRFEPIGEMFFLPAEHRIHAQSDCREQSSIVLNFDPGAVSTWFGELRWTECRLQRGLDITSNSLSSLLLRIRDEITRPGFASNVIVEVIAAQIAIELSRYLREIEERASRGRLATWRLKLIDERLSDEGAAPTLAELARECALSVRQLTRAFRASRGRSIGSVIAEQRVERAKRLLASDMCIKAVAYATGFSAPSNFSAAFLRATGETPRQYRHRAGHRDHDASTAEAGEPNLH